MVMSIIAAAIWFVVCSVNALANAALLLSVRLACLCMGETDGDGSDCGPNQGKES